MLPSLPVVRSAQPERLGEAASRAGESLTSLQQQLTEARQTIARMRSGWEGAASDAAQASAERTLARQEQVVVALRRLWSTLSKGATQLGATRDGILDAVGRLEQVGYRVSDDGSVSVQPGSRLDQLARLSAPTAMRIQSVAASSAVQLKSQLANFGSRDEALSQELLAISGELESG